MVHKIVLLFILTTSWHLRFDSNSSKCATFVNCSLGTTKLEKV